MSSNKHLGTLDAHQQEAQRMGVLNTLFAFFLRVEDSALNDIYTTPAQIENIERYVYNPYTGISRKPNNPEIIALHENYFVDWWYAKYNVFGDKDPKATQHTFLRSSRKKVYRSRLLNIQQVLIFNLTI